MTDHPQTAASLFSFWAKTDTEDKSAVPAHHLLVYHGLDVGACAWVLLERQPKLRAQLGRLLRMEDAQVSRFVPFLVALHDMGKFAEGFQNLHPGLFAHLRGRTSQAEYQVRHDTLGMWLWEDFLCRAAYQEDWFGPAGALERDDLELGMAPLLRAITGHHGQPPGQHAHLRRRAYFDETSVSAAQDFARECARLMLDGPIWSDEVWEQDTQYLDDFTPAASWLLAGVTVLADWLGSDEKIFSFWADGAGGEPISLGAYWHDWALPRAARAVEASGIVAGAPAAWRGFEALFPGKTPRPMQQYAIDAPVTAAPQLFILEDATGSGKTEAALILAHRMMAEDAADGIYVALPTMATANAMYSRMAEAYHALFEEPQKASLILAHGASWLHTEFRQTIDLGSNPRRAGQNYGSAHDHATATAQCTRWLADNRKKALLAAVGVGTVDQALMAVLPAKHQSLRLLGLAQKILIIDEVHAYDSYMSGLLATLLEFHAAQGGSAILLSATLPQTMRQSLCNAFRRGATAPQLPPPLALTHTDFPLATRICTVPGTVQAQEEPIPRIPEAARRVQVKIEPSEDAVLQQILTAARAGQCVCWIRNTVTDAMDAHEQLAAHLTDDNLLLFHARFALVDRQRIEARVLELFGKDSQPATRAGKVLVATQVVEQSLDLDFDFMVSDLAPVELMVQRAGRLHRHRRAERPHAAGQHAPLMLIHGPSHQPADGSEIAADWYASVFARGAFVYPNVAQLWLSAKILAEIGEIHIPDDARRLIEAVYGPDADECVPEALIAASRTAEAQAHVARSMANFNALKLAKGYDIDASEDWFSEARTPTRLGEESRTLRLARVVEGQLLPWAQGATFPWAQSELSVRAAQIAHEATPSAEVKPLIAQARETMADRGKWSILLPLQLDETGFWRGRAKNLRDQEISIAYSNKFGLQIISE